MQAKHIARGKKRHSANVSSAVKDQFRGLLWIYCVLRTTQASKWDKSRHTGSSCI